MKNKKTKNSKFEDDKIVKIKVDDKEQIISKFSYDDDKLNKDLSEYIIDKVQDVNYKQEVNLQIFTSEEVAQTEIQDAIKNHFERELISAKAELRKNNHFSIVMLILGILSIGILVLSYNFFPNFYFDMIIEIASWVFVWEAVDATFLKRPSLRKHCIILQKLCKSKIEIQNQKYSKEV